jgi:hypothetical protein
MPLYYFIAAPMLLLASVGLFAQAQPKIDIETMSAVTPGAVARELLMSMGAVADQ